MLCYQLETLNLSSWCGRSGVGSSSWTPLHNLRSFDLTGCSLITDSGLGHLKSLTKKMHQIGYTLILSGCVKKKKIVPRSLRCSSGHLIVFQCDTDAISPTFRKERTARNVHKPFFLSNLPLDFFSTKDTALNCESSLILVSQRVHLHSSKPHDAPFPLSEVDCRKKSKK